MNLAEHYHKLYIESIAKISSGDYETDHLIDDEADQRFGITLVIRPDAATKDKIQQFLTEAKAIEPDQYYYQNADIHITLMSIISCYEGFDLKDIHIGDYIQLIKQVLARHKHFKIQFKGLTASPSCILIQGFLTDTLNKIRDDLRAAFKNSDLQQSIDKRYAIQTAHATVIRFRSELANIDALLSLIEKYRDFDFGTFEVKHVELVYNDWYQREKFVKKLYQFSLS
ncbi:MULTISPECIES: 2'-5' RNA ligase family protein [unclassified Pedobacter]|uniref:2'-5' RNA ligase family protein n=1 Tax=unclassified Pedobacter TaxID=2628915 RepID=UPI00141E74F5|nr:MULTISPECIES: 2'-5' RNA ligase family protein [unclassified Pedobacter]NII81609.1 2'-5' RNA ligase [Pedobacter sp. SG908]NMN35613.1 2'-5' RNA ligase [Pedobacter sp. SG918]